MKGLSDSVREDSAGYQIEDSSPVRVCFDIEGLPHPLELFQLHQCSLPSISTPTMFLHHRSPHFRHWEEGAAPRHRPQSLLFQDQEEGTALKSLFPSISTPGGVPSPPPAFTLISTPGGVDDPTLPPFSSMEEATAPGRRRATLVPIFRSSRCLLHLDNVGISKKARGVSCLKRHQLVSFLHRMKGLPACRCERLKRS